MKPTDLLLTGALAGAGLAAGCAQTAAAPEEAPWRVDSAPTPAGWPEATPVDAVVVRESPRTRIARVQRDAAERDAMFMTLFRHIERHEIEMTAPVEMVYADAEADGARRLSSMAFLYRDTGIGSPGSDGVVDVRDVEPGLYASTGVRGGYTDANFREGLARVEAWLAEHAGTWEAVGPPRYLGDNGPLTFPFLRYGEVQVPVARRDALAGATR